MAGRRYNQDVALRNVAQCRAMSRNVAQCRASSPAAGGLRGLRTAGIYGLARDLRLDADDLLPLAEAANLLGFADIEAGDVTPTATGRRFGDADILSKKEIFRQQATGSTRRLREIVRRLQTAPERRVAEDDVVEALERAFSAPEAATSSIRLSTGAAMPSYSPMMTTRASSTLTRRFSPQPSDCRRIDRRCPFRECLIVL